MRAAFNIGLYYEMKDNPATAIEWVEKQINWQSRYDRSYCYCFLFIEIEGASGPIASVKHTNESFQR